MTIAWGSAVAAQGLPPISTTFADGSTLRFTGQINQGVLSYDDGRESNSYGLVDNANSGTRLGLRYNRGLGADWDFGTRLEIGYSPFSTSDVSILNQSNGDWGFDNDNIRWIDFSFDNESIGTVSLGQGSMATDGVAEVDLSGTSLIGYSSVGDSAGGQFLRFRNLEDAIDTTDPANADLTLDSDEVIALGPTIGSTFANCDGSRRVRIRYDTPEFNGFSGAISYGRNLLSSNSDSRDQDLFDAGLTYGGSVGDAVEFAAALGYAYSADEGSRRGGNIITASGSALHTPTGLNLTGAAGYNDPNGGDSGNYWYAKLGLLRAFIDAGDTALAVDYYSGDSIDSDGDESESWGLMAVQNLDRFNTEIWLTYREYSYDTDDVAFEDGEAIFGGLRFRF
jgi:hypothetical protein